METMNVNSIEQTSYELQTVVLRPNSKPVATSTYKELAIQWLNEALYFVSSSIVADSFRFRNRQLLVTAKRCA